MSKFWVLVAAAAVAAAPGAIAAGSCVGEACGAIASASDACTISNKGDKSVQLTTVADQSALMMTILSPGETIKQDKSLCEKFARGEAHFDARYATLRAMPDEPDFTLKSTKVAAAAPGKPTPKPKPSPATATAAPAPAPEAAPAPMTVAAVAPGPAIPRTKPAPAPVGPPLPRVKPPLPAATAQAAPPQAPASTVAAVAPTAAVAPAEPPTDCGASCATVLFKVVDNCLWVVNPNPRPVAFEVEAGSQRLALTLEAADGDKADARAAALAKGQSAKDDAALHMRLHDPFQSAGSGIPIFRARLGSPTACVHERKDVTRFSARFVN